VITDNKILKKHFDVKSINHTDDWLKFIFRIFGIAKNVLQSDLSFSWFAERHSAFAVLFSKLFRKKSIVVVGGFDVAYVPEIKYGAFANLKQKIPAEYVLRNADMVLSVSNFTKNEILKRVKTKHLKLVYNGIDIEKFKPSEEKKEKIVVTIASVTKQSIKLKGLETFAKASIHFPDYKFVIIGYTDDSAINELKKINPKLIFTGHITHEKVLKWLQRAKVYCQLSYIESFGLGNAEAMSCSCIPVVTGKGALSEVVGKTGFYVSYGDEKATIKEIKKALDAPSELGKKARERIMKMFSLERREEELVKTIRSL